MYRIIKNIFLFLFCFFSPYIHAVVVGSNSAVSREGAVVFPNADSDNEMRGFAVFEGGVTLELPTTSCIYNALFHMSDRLSLNGATLNLQKNLVLTGNPHISSVGTINGNNNLIDIRSNGEFIIPSGTRQQVLSQIAASNTGSAVMSVDWSYDNTYIAAGVDAGQKVIIYSFDGINLTYYTEVTFSQPINCVRWHPNSYFLAIARGGGSGDELCIYEFDPSLGSLNKKDSLSLSKSAQGLSWDPSGTLLAVSSGSGTGSTSLELESVSASGVITNLTDYNLAPNNAFSTNAVSFDSTGTYITVGLVVSATESELIVFKYNGIALTENVSFNLGETVEEVAFSPTTSLLAVVFSTGSERLKIYQHDGIAGTLTEITSFRIDESRTVRSVCWSSDSSELAIAIEDSGAAILQRYEVDLDNSTLSLIAETTLTSNLGVTSIRYTTDKKYFVTGDKSDYVQILRGEVTSPSDELILDSTNVVFKTNLTLEKNVRFRGESQLSGSGNILTIKTGNSLIIDAASTLKITDVLLKNVGDSAGLIVLENTDSILELNNATIDLADDLTTTQGTLSITGPSFVIVKNHTWTITGSAHMSVDGVTLWKDQAGGTTTGTIVFDTPQSNFLTLLNDGAIKLISVDAEDLSTRVEAVESCCDAHDTRLSSLETNDATQDSRLTTVEAKNIEQDGRLALLEAKDIVHDSRLDVIDLIDATQNVRLSNLEATDSLQNSRLDVINAENAIQDARLDAVETKNNQQDSRVDSIDMLNITQNNRLDSLETSETTQDSRLDVIEASNTTQNARLNAVEAKDAAQDARLDDLEAVVIVHDALIAKNQSCCDEHDLRLNFIEETNLNYTSRLASMDTINDVQNSQIITLESCCEIHDTQLQNLEVESKQLLSHVDMLQQDVDALELQTPDGLDARLIAVESCCDIHDSRLEAIEHNVDILEIATPDGLISLIDTLESESTEYDSRITALESCCNLHNSQIGQLQSDIDVLELQSSDSITNRINVLESQTDYYDSRFDNAENNIAIIQSYVDQHTSQILEHDSRVDVLESCCDAHDIRLNSVETKNTQQDTRLAAIESKNITQDIRLSALDSIDNAQNLRLTDIENKNTQQDTRLTLLEARDTNHEARLAIVEFKNTEQDQIISQHTSHLDLVDTSLNILKQTAQNHETRLTFVEDITNDQASSIEELESCLGILKMQTDEDLISRIELLEEGKTTTNAHLNSLDVITEGHEAQLLITENKNSEQDSRLDDLDLQMNEQENRITTIEGCCNDHETRIASLEMSHGNNNPNYHALQVHNSALDFALNMQNNVLANHAGRLGALEECCQQHTAMLLEHDSLIDKLEFETPEGLITRIEKLESSADKLADISNIHDTRLSLVELCCDTQDSYLDALENQLNLVQMQTPVALNSRIEKLESSTDVLAIATSANDFELLILNEHDNVHESLIDGLEFRVNLLTKQSNKRVASLVDLINDEVEMLYDEVGELSSCCDQHAVRLHALENNEVIQNSQLLAIKSVNATQNDQINAIMVKNIEQGTRLDGIESGNVTRDLRLTAIESKNVSQDNRMNTIEALNITQSTRLDAVEGKNAMQDRRLNALEAKEIVQDNQLIAVEAKNAQQDTRLNIIESNDSNQSIRITAVEAKDVLQDNKLTQQGTQIDELQTCVGVLKSESTPIVSSRLDTLESQIDSFDIITNVIYSYEQNIQSSNTQLNFLADIVEKYGQTIAEHDVCINNNKNVIRKNNTEIKKCKKTLSSVQSSLKKLDESLNQFIEEYKGHVRTITICAQEQFAPEMLPQAGEVVVFNLDNCMNHVPELTINSRRFATKKSRVSGLDTIEIANNSRIIFRGDGIVRITQNTLFDLSNADIIIQDGALLMLDPGVTVQVVGIPLQKKRNANTQGGSLIVRRGGQIILDQPSHFVIGDQADQVNVTVEFDGAIIIDHEDALMSFAAGNTDICLNNHGVMNVTNGIVEFNMINKDRTVSAVSNLQLSSGARLEITRDLYNLGMLRIAPNKNDTEITLNAQTGVIVGGGTVEYLTFNKRGSILIDSALLMQNHVTTVTGTMFDVFKALSSIKDLDNIISPEAILAYRSLSLGFDEKQLVVFAPSNDGTVFNLNNDDRDIYYDSSQIGSELDIIKGYNWNNQSFTIDQDGNRS